MSELSAKARAASYFEKKFDRRKSCDLYLMCDEDTELMDEVIEELADEFRAAIQADRERYTNLPCDSRDYKFRKGWEAYAAAIREGEEK